jgi:putative zinc finger/helix-turn-helix YgiT family protein
MATAEKLISSSIPDECPVCGTSGSVSLWKGEYRANYNRIPVELGEIERCACSACGEKFFTAQQSRELSRRVKAAARSHMKVLSPEQIVSIREKLGLSQEALEDLLGLGAKVVTRWENGKVIPGRATDYILRLMDRMPEVVHALRAIRQEVGGAASDSLD